MATRLGLRCTCGKVRGTAEVSPDSGNRLVCYCDDCQAFARFLARDDVMDPAGGTDIFQMAPAALRITEGAELLRCVRLSDKGLYRWYTECCRTPIGNMVGARFPFIGVIHAFMDDEGGSRSLDDALGKPLGFILGKFAIGGLPPHAHPKMPLPLLARCIRLVLGWWITGQGSPSPFFDAKTRAPRVAPRVLGVPERQALRRVAT
jgi:hypothetical protein